MENGFGGGFDAEDRSKVVVVMISVRGEALAGDCLHNCHESKRLLYSYGGVLGC